MADKGPVWDRSVKKHCLIPRRYEDIVASWQLTDYVLWHGRTCPHHSLVSTIKARQHGCHHCVDTEAMFDRIFTCLPTERVLPSPSHQ